MKKIPIFLTLLLMGAWAYTSWYWYTCNIKGFCKTQSYTYQNKQNTSDQNNSFIDGETKSFSGQGENNQGQIISQNLENTGGIIEEAQKLSADDVLSASIPKQENTQTQEASLSGSLQEDISEGEEKNENNTSGDEANQDIASLCSIPLVGPIGLGTQNDTQEVKRLENFLNSQGENLTIDGTYTQEDYDAVSRFQLKYKAQILDPWDITSPTGYVYRTTVKTMNDIACGNLPQQDASISESEE